jgi:hypothetical protein
VVHLLLDGRQAAAVPLLAYAFDREARPAAPVHGLAYHPEAAAAQLATHVELGVEVALVTPTQASLLRRRR